MRERADFSIITCNYAAAVRRGVLFLLVLIGYVILFYYDTPWGLHIIILPLIFATLVV